MSKSNKPLRQTKSVYIPRGNNNFFVRALSACAIDLFGPPSVSENGMPLGNDSKFIRALIDAYFTQKGLLVGGRPNMEKLQELEKANQTKANTPILHLDVKPK